MSLNWNKPKRQQKEGGTQVVEFAIVLPLLLFIGLAIIEGATFVRIHQVINNAAREGARVGSVDWARSFVDHGTTRNVLGEAAACKYLNDNKSVFPDWDGGNCTAPFSVRVEPFTITSGPSPMYATRAVVQYHYVFKYVPLLAYFKPGGAGLDLEGRAQFENFYPEATP